MPESSNKQESFECPSCERDFDSEHGMKVHHTQSHGESIAKEECVCDNCGCTFEEFQSKAKRCDGVYCSLECNYDDKRVEIVCTYCGDEEKRPKWLDNKTDVKYCSRECYQKHMKENPSETPNWNDYDRVSLECDYCGNVIRRIESKVNDKYNFCSRDCTAKWCSEVHSGSGYTRWRGGHKDSMLGGWKNSRQKALNKYDNTCANCGMKSEEHKEKYGKDLEVHHKIPYRLFDEPEEAHKLSNLMVLCIPCHGKIEASTEI